MKKNDDINLTIDTVTGTGSGIGRYENMAVFVSGTAVGDEIQAHIIKVKKNYAIGIIKQIIKPSNDRKDTHCPVYKSCGGCVFCHLNYDAECRIKQQTVFDAVKRIGNISLEPCNIIKAVKTDGYRNKAQFPVAQNENNIYFGFYAGHSHRVIENNFCDLQPSIFGDVLIIIKRWAEKNKITAYNEDEHKGILRHILIRFAEKTKQLMVVPVINCKELPFADELAEMLHTEFGETLKSVCYNVNRERTNVIMGEKCVTVFGDGYITDEICGVSVRISPLSFYQVNRTMAEVLYKKAAEYIDSEDKFIVDLFCGTGTIGLSVLKTAGDENRKLIGVEIVKQAVDDAVRNAKEAGINNATFICGDADSAVIELKNENIKPDAVILDPPRKGCTEQLLKTVSSGFCPKKIIYISCDPATFARDAAILEQNGYSLSKYTPVDLFPGTAHVETVALMLRKNPYFIRTF